MSVIETISHDNDFSNLLAGAALSEYRLVKLSTIALVYCAAGDTTPTPVGRTNDAAANGANASVTPLQRGAMMRLTAGAAISAGAAVYPAANGKISSTAASGTQIGWAIDAASGDGAEITVLITY